MLGINLEKLKFLIDIHSEKLGLKDDTGAKINDQTYGKSEIYFSALLVFARIVTIYATTNMRNSDFTYKKNTKNLWILIFGIYFLSVILYFMSKISPLTTIVYYLDIIMLVGQFVYYQINI